MTEQKIALITGANKGLGKAVARELGRLGMKVYLGSRDVDRGHPRRRSWPPRVRISSRFHST